MTNYGKRIEPNAFETEQVKSGHSGSVIVDKYKTGDAGFSPKSC